AASRRFPISYRSSIQLTIADEAFAMKPFSFSRFDALLFPAKAPRRQRKAQVMRYEPLEVRAMMTATLSVGSAECYGGDWLAFEITYADVPPGSALTFGEGDRTAHTPDDYLPNDQTIAASGSGTATALVQTKPNYSNSDDKTLWFSAGITMGTDILSATVLGTIKERTGMARVSDCDCTCGTFIPSASPNSGSPEGHLPADGGDNTRAGGGGPPGITLQYAGAATPHPIVSAHDVLSAAVSSAADIKTQVTLLDAGGDTVYTGTPVYYSPSGYTAGSAVKFGQQIDAGSLPEGEYTSVMTVSEEYSGAAPVVRTYSDVLDVRNLDQTPYGRGWMLSGQSKLDVSASGAGLEDDYGNLYYFSGDAFMGYAPPPDQRGQMSLLGNWDGTFTLTLEDASKEIFSSAGLMTSRTDPLGNTTSFTYNADDTLATETDPAGRATTFGYAGGQLTSITDFAGRVTTLGYAGGLLTSVVRPDPGHGEAVSSTSFTYDPATGLLLTSADSSGTKTFAY
ncbi:MAG: hypothetical protein ACRDRL_19990, partial [Sciscionella sp.]